MNLLDVLYVPLALVTVPAWAGKKRAGWRERFGRTPPLAAAARPRVLLHAVSVGEVSALRELVPLLALHAEVVISVTTDTGIARAMALFAGTAAIVRYPLDFSWSVRRFLDAVRPDVVGLVELEVWPNFVAACHGRGVPVAVINGRVSERSFRGYRRVREFFARSLRRLAVVAVQDEVYRGRFIALGVPPERCRVTGSMKWDSVRLEGAPAAERRSTHEALRRELGIDPERPLVVAGSTGPGEEALLHAACPEGVQLACAPRKPERFDEAAGALPGCVRLSGVRAGEPRRVTDRFLIDTIGDLSDAYALADVVVVGRSFGGLHGSDPIEAIALGKATVIGPAVADFAGIVAEFERHGGIARADRSSLAAVLADLLADPAKRAALAAGGASAIRANQGAAARHRDLLLALLPPADERPTMQPDRVAPVGVSGSAR